MPNLTEGAHLHRNLAIHAASGVALLAGVLTLGAAPASATAQTGSAAGTTFDLGPSPVGLPSSCPFANGDANFLFVSGTTVSHGTSNKNGGWGGMTSEGTANFYEGSTLWDVGHLTVWEGGGGNVRGQNEGGLTLDYHGSGTSGSVDIHVNGHMTTSASGEPTAHVVDVRVTCDSGA